MKKTIKLTLAVVFVMGATSLFAQKFGRINTQEVISPGRSNPGALPQRR